MRQLTMTEDRAVEWRDVPEPELREPGDAIVRPLAVALCDLDQPILRGDAPVPGPIALGHEFVAEVVEGAAFPPGERVVVPFQISCGECETCRLGLTGSCLAVPQLAMFGFGAFGNDWGGALSDLVRVPFAEHMLVPVPNGVSPAAIASASDNIPDGWRAVAAGLEARPGAEVLVVGGGAPSIALYAVDAALALGATGVTYLDTDPERLQVAAALGADAVETKPPRRHGSYAVTVDASGSHAGLACALRSTGPGGTCTSVSIFFEAETPVPLLEMYTTGVHFHAGRAQARPMIPRILELVAEGKLRPELVTSNVVPWDDAPEAVLEPERKLVIERAQDNRGV
jgi:alcohol dehydrogenase